MNDIREEIIGFRYSATGVFGYHFYRGQEKICSVSSIVPPSTIMISGSGYSWESENPNRWFSREALLSTVRYVTDRETKEQVAQIAWGDHEGYVINNLYEVKGHSFIRGNETVAEIHRFKGQPEWQPEFSGFDIEAYFEVDFLSNLDDEIKMLIMAFPMLKLL